MSDQSLRLFDVTVIKWSGLAKRRVLFLSRSCFNRRGLARRILDSLWFRGKIAKDFEWN